MRVHNFVQPDACLAPVAGTKPMSGCCLAPIDARLTLDVLRGESAMVAPQYFASIAGNVLLACLQVAYFS